MSFVDTFVVAEDVEREKSGSIGASCAGCVRFLEDPFYSVQVVVS